jgi:aryl-alcohol dehydrogenase-like predicted oxidoreductase
VRDIRALARAALPRDATVAVISKGDEKLRRLDCRRVWHFPCDADGRYAGYHPGDSEAAVRELELARRRGADYLLIPATASWWLDHYAGFAEHLERHYPLVRRDDACAVYAVGRNPALYGRRREAEVTAHDDALRVSAGGLARRAAGRVGLGRELSVSRIGLGALHLARMDDSAAVKALLHRALELGVDLLDTADVYGAGLSEQRIADALHPYPRELVIATKAGFRPAGAARGSRPDGRPEHLRAACEASLRRLRLDAIPLFQLHTPDPQVPLEESLGALVELRAEGKVVEIGVSNVSGEELERALAVAPVVSVQNGFNVCRVRKRGPHEQLDVCQREGVAYVAWQPLGAGAMQRPDPSVDGIARRLGATRSQIALAWILQQSPVTVAIPGTTSLEHLEQNVAAAPLRLSADELAARAPRRAPELVG